VIREREREREVYWQSIDDWRSVSTTPLPGCLSSALLRARQASGNKFKTKGPWPPVSIINWKRCFQLKAGGRFWTVDCNKGLRDALLRGPKTFVLCNRKPSYSDLWSVLGVARAQVGMERWSACQHTVWETATTSLWSVSLLFLIEIPWRCRPHGRRKWGSRLWVASHD
jgi:hypothetical protein